MAIRLRASETPIASVPLLPEVIAAVSAAPKTVAVTVDVSDASTDTAPPVTVGVRTPVVTVLDVIFATIVLSIVLSELAPAPEPAAFVLLPPPLTTAATPNVSAVIVAVEVALSARPPGAVSVEASRVADTVLAMSLIATAPATAICWPPLELRLRIAPTPPASDVIVEASCAVSVATVAALVSVMTLAPAILASIVLRMRLREPAPAPAKEKPACVLEPEGKTPPPANDSASTVVRIEEASRSTSAAVTLAAPSIRARTMFVMSFEATEMPIASAGGPRAPTTATPPASAAMSVSSVADTFSAPVAVTEPPAIQATMSLSTELPAPLPAPANEAPPPVPVFTEPAIPSAKT